MLETNVTKHHQIWLQHLWWPDSIVLVREVAMKLWKASSEPFVIASIFLPAPPTFMSKKLCAPPPKVGKKICCPPSVSISMLYNVLTITVVS